MSTTFNILLVGALFCVLMLLVLGSLLRSAMPGIKEWCMANVLACVAFVLLAFGQELPPWIAYEAANGMYAAAMAVVLAGFRRFFGRKVYWIALGASVASLVLAIALLHYRFDSFASRTAVVALFQGVLCLCIALTIYRSRKTLRTRYPYFFTAAMALAVTLGHLVRSLMYARNADEMTSLLQPDPWNLFFLSAGTLALPMLMLGAVMMVHDKMLAQAEHAANRDFLTGAWSRRAFFELAARELSRAQRNGRALSLLLVDIDHFKHINDTSGHAGGDQVLVDVVLRAETVIRSIDYFARIGGEEFAALLPETNRAAAQVVAERLRAALDTKPATDKPKGKQDAAPYTVSIGVATLRHADSHTDLMRRADAALYAAKAIGRNRVVCESD
jgi:diguanylate cyclase (GGDEF)-like protein